MSGSGSQDRRNAGRFDALGSTPWTVLKGPDGLGYLVDRYGPAIQSVIAGRLARLEFPPLRVEDAEEVYLDLCARLLRTRWLQRYPQRGKGGFRPYLYRRIGMYLAERQRAALGRPSRHDVPLDAAGLEPAGPDTVAEAFEELWRAQMIEACLARVARADAEAGALLRVRLRMPGAPRQAQAEALQWPVARLREVLTRAHALFRAMWDEERHRFDEPAGGPQPPDWA